MKKKRKWRKYLLEFISIFVAVISAFALNNWSENRRDHEAASKILIEISNGLEKDLEDIKTNILGHEFGLESCEYWHRVLQGKEVGKDSLEHQFSRLTRDFISLQNSTGYESLKSKGLELIADDSLRNDIITLYEFEYQILDKMEEEYNEMQFQENYYNEFARILSPDFKFNEKGKLIDIARPLSISAKEKNLFLTHLLKIRSNRRFILTFYADMESKIQKLRQRIAQEIDE